MNYIQMEQIKTIEIKKLITMFVIAMGKQIGNGFTYMIKLPSCFGENIKFQDCKANLLALRVNSDLEIEVWFVDEDGNTFVYSLADIRETHPFLFVSIVTHVFDMIENINC